MPEPSPHSALSAGPDLARIFAVIRPPERFPEERIHPLREAIKGPSFVAELLLQRGIEEKEAARSYFLAPLEAPARAHTAPSPGLLHLEAAVTALTAAWEGGETVMVHGDYDADGITGTALLYGGLKRLGFSCDWFLPNRFDEGYGISRKSLDKIKDRGGKWIISVDTGIAAVEETAYAKSLGMKVVITDHHQAAPSLPAAEAIVNPNQPLCPYPNKFLSGVGVAYKLLEALALRLRGPDSFIAESQLDLVALGSIADNVPITGENRCLVKAGLRQLAVHPRPGLRILMNRLGLQGGEVHSADLLYKLCPLINAAGRMGSPEIALRLLLSEDDPESAALCDRLWEENLKRRRIDQEVTAEAFALCKADPLQKERPCLVLASEAWHEGVIGIVASRLVDEYHKPVFILAIDKNGMAKGSGRTVKGFNLHKALSSMPELFEKWGGHYFACGFSIRKERIDALRERMEEAARTYLTPGGDPPPVMPQVAIDLAELGEDSMTWLKRFEPFGPHNETPLFYAENVDLLQDPRVVGERHLKLVVGGAYGSFDAIGFNLAHLQPALKARQTGLKLAFYPEWNSFKGVRRIQLRLAAIGA